MPSSRDLRLWLHQPRGYVHPIHHHDELEFNFVVQGKGKYLLGDRCYELRRHSLVWLFTGQEHVLLETSPDYAGWIGVFKPHVVSQVAARYGILADHMLNPNPPGYFCRHVLSENAAALKSLCQSLVGVEMSDVCFNYGVPHLLLLAWEAFQCGEEIACGPNIHPAVKRAAYLLRDSEDDLDLARLARKAFMSPAHLSRLFKRQMGLSISQFRNQLRLQRFLSLYGQGHRRTMLDCMLRAGFGSYPQFYRFFRKQMGVTPAEYRQSISAQEGCDTQC